MQRNHLMSINLDLYTERIGLSNYISINEQLLYDIQTHQLSSIAFENIDCLHHLPIKIDVTSLEQKILYKNRGGYCFELNTLLHLALIEAGFKSRPLLSRVMYRGTGVNARTHIFLLVEINGKTYLTDAGFGGPGIFTPMPFEIDREDHQRNGVFRIHKDETFGYILQKKIITDDSWFNVYSFNLDLVYPADLDMSNFYTSTLPESHFRHNLIGALFTNEGRITLLNKTLTITTKDKSTTRDIPDHTTLLSVLKDDFKINLISEQKIIDF
jgi:N-hydroxyarylamine O-acetyltransferase